MSKVTVPILVMACILMCTFTPLLQQTWSAINEVNGCLEKAESFKAKTLNTVGNDDYKTLCYHTVAAPVVCGVCRVSAFISINEDLIDDIPYCSKYCGLLNKGVEGVLFVKSVKNIIKVEKESGLISNSWRLLKNLGSA